MLKAAFAEGKFDLERCPTRLLPGIYEFGRSLLKFEDMRVSRSQIQMDVWPDRVSVTRKGRNLSCVVRSGEVRQLEVDTPFELKEGDLVYLLVSLYSIKIEADNTSQHSLSHSSTELQGKSATEAEQNGKKRTREEVADTPEIASTSNHHKGKTTGDDSSDEEDVIVLTKKPKLKETDAPKTSTAPSASGHWSTGLLAYLKNPSNYPEAVVSFNDEIVVIKDKYPKAILHLLVMPRQSISNLSQLREEHLPLITNMYNMATQLSSEWLSKDASKAVGKMNPSPGPGTKSVRIGFHAIPSMTHLHLHVISDDFDSVSLKTKKHWNSFTSPFFIPATTILDTLKSGKAIQFEKSVYDAYLDAPMQCHRCKKVQQNIPTLKTHLASCTVTQ